MSLDDLFSLLLFALFIGVPLLSRFLRRGGPGPQRPPTGKAPPATRTGLPTTPTTQQRDATKNAAETAASDIGERLEQARRRVREAVEGQTARVDTRSAQTAQSTPQNPTGLESAGDMFRQRQDPPARPPVTPPARPVTSTFAAADASVQRSKRTTTKPLQVERSRNEKRAKLSSDLLTFSRDDIMRGIMWQQILDAPKCKRPWRNPSQHP